MNEEKLDNVVLYSMNRRKATELLFDGRVFKFDRLEADDNQKTSKNAVFDDAKPYTGGLMTFPEKEPIDHKLKRIVKKRYDFYDERLGQIVERTGSIAVRQRPLDMLNSYIRLQESPGRRGLMKILGDFYPKAKHASLEIYLDSYLKHVLNREKIVRDGFSHQNKHGTTKLVKRRYENKPDGALFFNKMYYQWVTQRNVNIVKSVMLTTWKAKKLVTAKAIIDETGLSYGTVSAVLHYLRDKNECKRYRQGRTFVFEPRFVNPPI